MDRKRRVLGIGAIQTKSRNIIKTNSYQEDGATAEQTPLGQRSPFVSSTNQAYGGKDLFKPTLFGPSANWRPGLAHKE